jgi:hypothetical protein
VIATAPPIDVCSSLMSQHRVRVSSIWKSQNESKAAAVGIRKDGTKPAGSRWRAFFGFLALGEQPTKAGFIYGPLPPDGSVARYGRPPQLPSPTRRGPCSTRRGGPLAGRARLECAQSQIERTASKAVISGESAPASNRSCLFRGGTCHDVAIPLHCLWPFSGSRPTVNCQ